MKTNPTTSDKDRLVAARCWPVVSALVFFGGAFLYLWLRVDSHLLYRAFCILVPESPVFSSGWTFFRQTLVQPGGLVTYLSGYLSQWYYYSWAGALILVAVAALLTELIRRHLVRAGLPRPFFVMCLPALAIFLVANQYRHPLYPALTVTMGVLFALVFEVLPVRKPVMRMVLYAIMAGIGHALMGAGGLYVFALMTVVYFVFLRRPWWLGGIVLAISAAIVWLAAEFVYFLPPDATFLIATPWSDYMIAGLTPRLGTLLIGLYVFVPAVMALMLLGRGLWSKRKPKPHPRKAKKEKSPSPTLAFTVRMVGLSLPPLVLAVALPLTYNPLLRDFKAINACAREGQWSQVLELARRLPKGQANVATNHEINRALYHTGRLPYEMFSFPQHPHALLLTHQRHPSDLTQLQLCDLFIELGNLNTAEKMAAELLASEGPMGVVLEKLAWINVIKGQERTARVYLNALRKDPIYGATAKAMLNGLDAGFPAEQAADIGRLRASFPDDPYGVTYGGSVEQILLGLLEDNPHNRMAFEYLMACYLLTRQLDKVMANLERVNTFDYEGLPTYYEEALLIWRTMNRQPIDPAALGISPETFKRYQAFLEASRAMKTGDPQAGMARLVRDFGTSYFFYYGFGRVGILAADVTEHRFVAQAP